MPYITTARESFAADNGILSTEGASETVSNAIDALLAITAPKLRRDFTTWMREEQATGALGFCSSMAPVLRGWVGAAKPGWFAEGELLISMAVASALEFELEAAAG